MLSEDVLFALNCAEDRYLEQAWDSLAQTPGRAAVRRRRILRTVLLAAALSALFLSTAFAAGWFGLGSLKAGRLFGTDVISLEGLSSSPEGQALTEWLAYYEEHRNDPYDAQEALALAEDYGSYGVTTRGMAEKLDALCETYSLRRLGKAQVPEDEKSYYRAAGVGKLTAGSDTIENDFSAGYVYEDGTFQFDGALYCVDRAYPILYQFRSSAKGTLGYVVMNIGDPGAYEEWTYTAPDGTTLNMANSEAGSLILLDTEDSFVVLSLSHASYADYYGDGVIDGVGDEPVRFTLSREELQTLAASFRWEALRSADAGMDEPFTSHRFNEPVRPALPEDADFSAVQEQDLYFVTLAYTEQIAPYIRDFELVDYELAQWNSQTTGWIAFRGTPKTALDWARVPSDGGDLFCRSLYLTPGGEAGSWLAGDAFDMLPAASLVSTKNIGTDENPDFIWLGTEIPEILSASLYVQQTGETYELGGDADGERLALLQGLLRYAGLLSAPPMQPGWNPLYLSLADGRTALVYTAADGSDSACLFGQWQGYGLGISLFDLFGVPLEAAGYRSENGIVTARHEYPDSALLFWDETDFAENGPALERRVMSDMVRATRYEYDNAGNRIRETSWEGDTMTMEKLTTYTDDGRPLHAETRWGGNWATEDYEYDAQGRLTAVISHDNDDPHGWTGGNIYYSYDADGVCRRTRG